MVKKFLNYEDVVTACNIEEVNQPLDGLLYDLDLLPEQVIGNEHLQCIVEVITSLKKQIDVLKIENDGI